MEAIVVTACTSAARIPKPIKTILIFCNLESPSAIICAKDIVLPQNLLH